MSFERYYFNVTTRKWVRSFDDPSETPVPIWGNGDARDFEVVFLKSPTTDSVEVIPATFSVQITLSDPSTPGTVMTSATAGAAVDSAYPFVLNITGAAIAAFMTSVTTPKSALVEFRITTALGENRYGSTVQIRPKQGTSATADPAAADPAIGRAEATAVYVPKEWPAGMRMVMTTDNGRRFLFYPREDGTFSGDEI